MKKNVFYKGPVMLTLAEQLLLIFIDDARQKIISPEILPVGLAGAILVDLYLLKKIDFSDGRVKKLTELPTGNVLLDRSLKLIQTEKEVKKVKYWLAELSDKKITRRAADALVMNNLLLIDGKRLILVSPYQSYPQNDATAKYWIKHNLRATIFGGEKLESQNIILLNLLKSCRMLNMVFTAGERRAAHKKLDELGNPPDLDAAQVEALPVLYKSMMEFAV